MSKSTPEPKGFQTESKDIYSVYSHNAERFFDEVEKSIPQFHQSITNLQRACISAWKNATESAISIQHEFAVKAGTQNVPTAMTKVIDNVSEEMIKAQSVQNKAALAAIDATQQSINTFHENSKSFNWLNQSAMQNWISAFTPARN
jgi:SMC interacting uncharacterized protein involved in chromosome segregation